MKWEKRTLGEICSFRAGIAFKNEFQGETTGDYPFIKVSDMNLSGNKIQINTANNWISETISERIRARPFQAGTTVFAKIGEAIKQNRVRYIVRETLIDNNMMGAIPNQEIVDPRFLYHRLSMFDFAATSSGAALPFLSVGVLTESKVLVPPVSVQRRIASILSAYDDLIENNRWRMKLLEETARQLYREWFVRLRFPGHERVKVTHGLPEGWERKPLVDIAPDLRDAANPADLEPGTPYIGLEHMPRRSITLSDWGTADQVTSAKLRYRAGDILFGKIRPYFHKVGFALTDGVSSSDSIILRPVAEELHAFVLLTVSSDWFVAVVSKTAKEGSKMPRADWNLMERHELAVPPARILNAFRDVVGPIVSQLKTLAFQNQKLRAARELLLPKLMSGEIAV